MPLLAIALTAADDRVREITGSAEFKRAAEALEAGHDQWVKDGDRPAARAPEPAGIVRYAEAVYRTEGIDVRRSASSTDANLPMSLGIPAVTMSRNASGGQEHAPDEWIGIEKDANVKLKRILLATILATAGAR